MAKHTLKEILGIFAMGAGHTHEKAVSDLYDAGFDAGKAHATEQAGLANTSAAPAAEGSTDETKETAEGESPEKDQSTEGAKA